MNDSDLRYLRRAIGLAEQSRAKGNHPFGGLLVDGEGCLLLEAENTVVTEGDGMGHAETNLISAASRGFSVEVLGACTLYTSTEPCPMCAGAIFWSGVGRVVYGLSEEGLYKITGTEEGAAVLYLPCRDVFEKGGRAVEVVGPLLEEEAARVHEGFWH